MPKQYARCLEVDVIVVVDDVQVLLLLIVGQGYLMHPPQICRVTEYYLLRFNWHILRIGSLLRIFYTIGNLLYWHVFRFCIEKTGSFFNEELVK